MPNSDPKLQQYFASLQKKIENMVLDTYYLAVIAV